MDLGAPIIAAARLYECVASEKSHRLVDMVDYYYTINVIGGT